MRVVAMFVALGICVFCKRSPASPNSVQRIVAFLRTSVSIVLLSKIAFSEMSVATERTSGVPVVL